MATGFKSVQARNPVTISLRRSITSCPVTGSRTDDPPTLHGDLSTEMQGPTSRFSNDSLWKYTACVQHLQVSHRVFSCLCYYHHQPYSLARLSEHTSGSGTSKGVRISDLTPLSNQRGRQGVQGSML